MLWVPPKVSAELLEERREREARALLFMHTTKVCDEFNPELKRIDPALEMVFLPEPMPLDVVSAGGRPGRYNIVREGSKGGPLSFMPIVGPDGEFVEPTSRIFDELKLMDWWDPAVRQARRDREQRLEDARRKRQEEERRELDEEVLERYLAATRTQVSMNDSVPWAQNASGYKRVKGASRGSQRASD